MSFPLALASKLPMDILLLQFYLRIVYSSVSERDIKSNILKCIFIDCKQFSAERLFKYSLTLTAICLVYLMTYFLFPASSV